MDPLVILGLIVGVGLLALGGRIRRRSIERTRPSEQKGD